MDVWFVDNGGLLIGLGSEAKNKNSIHIMTDAFFVKSNSNTFLQTVCMYIDMKLLNLLLFHNRLVFGHFSFTLLLLLCFYLAVRDKT